MKKLLTIFLALVLFSSCKKSSSPAAGEGITDSESNGADAAASVIGSASGAAEGVLGMLEANRTNEFGSEFGNELASEFGSEFQTMDYLDPQAASIHPASACSITTARSTCSAGLRTLDWGNCNLTIGKLTGGWTETFSNASCLMTSNGQSLVRTSPLGSTLTFTAGATLTTSTEGGTTWDATGMGSTGVTVIVGTSNRSITIDSIHQVLKGPRGRTWFDYFIQTVTPITVSGTRAGGDRTVSSGSLKIYHNRAEYNATHSFSAVVWADSSCCYPTSGAITSTFSGSVTGTSTMSFTATCGAATFTGTDGETSTVTLTQCQ